VDDDVRLRTQLRSGLSLSYVVQGPSSGVPILLLHAWGESLEAFDLVRPHLPVTAHVLAVDLRGHGSSDKPSAGYTLAEFASDVVEFLDALGLPEAIFVGASSGGYLAQLIAVTSPQRAAGLVLVGAPLRLPRGSQLVSEVSSLDDPPDQRWARSWLDGFARYQPVPQWFIDDRVEDVIKCPSHSFLGTLVGLVEAMPPTERGTILAPTTIMWGERDEILPLEDAYLLKAEIAGSRLVMCQETGHLVLWEQPELVGTEITHLWETITGPQKREAGASLQHPMRQRHRRRPPPFP
jgi:rifampin ADP-ribosylating transferase